MSSHLGEGLGSPSRMGFNGQLHEAGMYWQLLGNGYRAYNPLLMCFHSADILSPFSKGGLNAYTYCNRDPVNAVDISGRYSVSLLLTGAAVAASLVVGGAMAAVAASTQDKDVKAMYATVAAMAFIAAPLMAAMPVGGASLAGGVKARVSPLEGGFSTANSPKPYILYQGPAGKSQSYRALTSELPPPAIPVPASPMPAPKLNHAISARRDTVFYDGNLQTLPAFDFGTVSVSARSSLGSISSTSAAGPFQRRPAMLGRRRQHGIADRIRRARSSESKA